MFTKEYWDERAEKNGHTGLADPFLYGFDQQARKFALSEIIQKLKFLKKKKALDFGCGSGDFLELFKEFSIITGYDISKKVLENARNKNLDASLILTREIEKVKSGAFYDLIITVTVLQGFADEELNEALALFGSVLADKGYMICMEFFTTEELNTLIKQERITVKKWMQALKENGLVIVSQFAFYNHIYAPTISWKKYKNHFIVKALKPIRYLPFAKTYFSKKAKQIIYKERDILVSENSNFTIYIVQKKNHAN